MNQVEEALGLFLDSLPPDNEWWCPYCGTTDCTFDGRCDKCGTPIEENQPDTTMVESLRRALTALRSGELVVVDGKDIVHPMWVCRTCPVPECDMAGEDKFASCRTFPAIWGPKQVKRCRELRLAYLQRKDGE